MTTLHGNALSLRRHAKGCVPPEGMIASARDPWKLTFLFLKQPWTYRMSLDPLIRIPSSHVGASESLQSCLSHHLGLVFSLLVSIWECSEIGMSLSISWITFCHVALDSFSRLMSLTCFLLRVFVFLYWLGSSFHLIVTYLMLWDMFIDHDHLFTLYTYHGPSTPFFVQSLIQFSTRCSYFHYRKMKGTFSHARFHIHVFFERFRLDHLIIFSLYGAWVESWVKDMWL